jgi:hypothetical protein
MASGLSIRSNSTSWTGFHEAFKGEDGTELVIGEHSDVEITFAQEVECLRLEYYVVSDFLCDDLHMLFDAENHDHDLAAPTLRSFYWLTSEGSGLRDLRPGPIATHPYQLIEGPFRRLTISTSQAGTRASAASNGPAPTAIEPRRLSRLRHCLHAVEPRRKARRSAHGPQ